MNFGRKGPSSLFISHKIIIIFFSHLTASYQVAGKFSLRDCLQVTSTTLSQLALCFLCWASQAQRQPTINLLSKKQGGFGLGSSLSRRMAQPTCFY